MDLKSGRTVWLQTDRPLPRFPRLRSNLRCDVGIIGTGITGALVAHRLIVAGYRVVMLDKRPAFTGSTSASTALLLYETDFSLAELSKKHGLRAAQRTYALGRQAIREIEKIAKAFKISCDFKRRHSLYLASDRRGQRLVQKEFTARKRAGFPVALLTRKQIREKFGLNFPAALYSAGAAEVDAVKLSAGLLAHHVRTGKLRVFSHTTVEKILPSDDGVRLHIKNGKHVDALCDRGHGL